MDVVSEEVSLLAVGCAQLIVTRKSAALAPFFEKYDDTWYSALDWAVTTNWPVPPFAETVVCTVFSLVLVSIL